MPQTNTYALARPYPAGLSITDAIMVLGGRRRPIRLERAGDAVDLNTVDVETFARSAFGGTIRQLFLTGVLASVQQEIPVERAQALNAAFGRLQENGGNMSGIAGAPTILHAGPGLQVAVMNVPDIKTELPDVPSESAAITVSREFEPGSQGPGAVDPGDGQPASAAALEGPKAKGKKKKAVKDPAGDTPAGKAEPGFAAWKDNLDFQTQKTRLAESADMALLGWVSKNDDSRQLQKIAAARLAELDRAGAMPQGGQ